MANLRISELSENTTPALDDLIPIVDVSDTPDATEKITVANLLGAWKTWASPISSGLSVGDTGTTTARYCQIGKTVFFTFEATLDGAGISVGSIILNAPVTARGGSNLPCGSGAIIDGSNTASTVMARLTSTSTIQCYAETADTTYVDLTATSSTVPMTWAATDDISVYGFYEAA